MVEQALTRYKCDSNTAVRFKLGKASIHVVLRNSPMHEVYSYSMCQFSFSGNLYKLLDMYFRVVNIPVNVKHAIEKKILRRSEFA